MRLPCHSCSCGCPACRERKGDPAQATLAVTSRPSMAQIPGLYPKSKSSSPRYGCKNMTDTLTIELLAIIADLGYTWEPEINHIISEPCNDRIAVR